MPDDGKLQRSVLKSMQQKTPPRQKHSVQSLDMARNELRGIYAEYKSWRRVAIEYGSKIPAGTLCAIAKGREPKKAIHRAALGLPALAPAPVCLKCGAVHVTKRCTSSGDKPPRRARIAVSLKDAASAAKAIRKHGGVAYALQLAKMLEEET